MKTFLQLFTILTFFCISFPSFAQYTPISKDTIMEWSYFTMSKPNSNQSHVLPFSVSDIVIPEKNKLWITTNGGNTWTEKELPEGFEIPTRSGNTRLMKYASRPSKTTLLLIAEKRVGETIIIKEGIGIDPNDPTTWRYLAELETALLSTFDFGVSWDIQHRRKDTVDQKFYQNRMTLGIRDSLVYSLLLNKDSVAITQDGGENWQIKPLSNQPSTEIRPIQILFTKNSQIIINYTGVGGVTFGDLSGSGGEYLLSNDNGSTWQKNSLPRGGVLHTTEKNEWYLFHESSILNNGKSEVFFSKSIDAGQSWETIFTQSWPQGRGGERASSKGKTLTIASRGSFSPVMGQLLPISYDNGVTWNYPEFPDSLFGTNDINGGAVTGGVAVPLSGFSDIQLVDSGLVGLAGNGNVVVIGKFKKDIKTSVFMNEYNSYSLTVSPNPVSQSAFVKYELPIGEQSAIMTIHDALGMEVISIPLENSKEGHIHIGTAKLANGTYHLRIRKGSFSTSQLLVVHR